MCQLQTGKGRHNGHSDKTATFSDLNRRIASFQLATRLELVQPSHYFFVVLAAKLRQSNLVQKKSARLGGTAATATTDSMAPHPLRSCNRRLWTGIIMTNCCFWSAFPSNPILFRSRTIRNRFEFQKASFLKLTPYTLSPSHDGSTQPH